MLTLRPRAARAVTLPAVRRGEDTQTASQQRRALSWSGERPPLWVVLPAVLVAILELLPLLYLVARTFEASANIWPARPAEVFGHRWGVTKLISALAETRQDLLVFEPVAESDRTCCEVPICDRV